MALRSSLMLGVLWLAACANDGSASADGVVTCEGDHWGSSMEMLAEISDCTTITGDLTMTGNDLLTIELPQLVKVDGTLSASLSPALTDISLPALVRVGGSLRVDNNDALASLELPALAKVNERNVDDLFDLAIRDNPLLPNCQAAAIRDRLIDYGFDGSSEITRNSEDCPR